MSTLRILIVDDEAPARRRLARMLGKIAGVEVAGEARDGDEALERIDALAPDLVLLDIQMPGMDGLGLARSGRALPPIIFTTAHAEHAVAAFELAAIDYLLKPIDEARLTRAIDRARARPMAITSSALAGLLQQALGKTTAPPRMAARSKSAVRLFDPREVTRFWAADKYSMVRLGNEELVLDDTLAALEVKLAPFDFVRVHRGELVSLAQVRAVHTDGGETWLELSDGQRADVSRRLAPEIRARLGI
jgi:two-component system, LytTR family, response regulator